MKKVGRCGLVFAVVIAGFARSDSRDSQKSAQSAGAPTTVVGVAPTTAGTASRAGMRPDRVFWGDEHVHTGWSADAGLAGTTLGPEDALRFARGQGVALADATVKRWHDMLPRMPPNRGMK